VLAAQGFITLEAGIALAFGANIGTCVTALLAALGKPRTAVQAATAHVVFNVLGVAVWFFFIDELANLVRTISPSHPELAGAARLSAEAPRQIANAHTVFNVANTVLFLWFTGPLAALVQRLVPVRPEVMPERAKPMYLDEVYFETPDIALDRVRLELVRLGEGVQEMLDKAPAAVRNGSREDLDDLVTRNDDSTRLYEAIVAYMAQLSRLELGSRPTKQLTNLMGIANTIDNMGDTIATNLVGLGQERLEANIEPSEATVEAFEPLREAVQEAFRMAVDSVRNQDAQAAEEVIAMKDRIQSLAHEVNGHLAARVATA
jgi:phosphate:Na+ symporter